MAASIQIGLKEPGIGAGAYTIAETALYLRTSPDKIRRWSTKTDRNGKMVPPVIERLDAISNLLTFYDLVELAFVRGFRKAGVPLPKIRKAHQVLKKEIGTPYPFATDDFVTDGSQILDKNSLYDVVTKQKVFDYISDLIVKITPDPDGLAKELFPQNADNLVVFDPNRSFGSPICLRGGVRTEIIYRTYRAEGDINAVADWYEISPEDVAGAVKFEETIRAA